MTTGRRSITRPGSPFIVISLFVAALAGLLTASAAHAANGAQPTPTLTPSPVPTASTNFALSNGSCDGTGAAGWRVQTFIVNGGVDLSTLTFESGVAQDQVGTDQDNANGSIRAPLFKGNAAGTGFIPAASPSGLINPSDLSGFNFASAAWVLTDGVYQIGYACVDEMSLIRQWWSITVTIDADASPAAFLTVGGSTGTTTTTTSGGGSTTTSTTTGGGSTTTIGGGSTTTTIVGTTTTAPGGSTTTTLGSGSTTSTARGASVLSAGSSQGSDSSGSLAATGQGLAVAGIGLVLIYLGRVAYLLGQPRRSAGGR